MILSAFLIMAVAGENTSPSEVCRELQARYAEMASANEARDLDRILALRAPDFSTIPPNGERSSYADMAEYSRRLVAAMRPPIKLRNTILTLTIEGDTATVDVLQEFSRRQVMGSVERSVETSVLQRERWRRTSAGWRLEFVDDVHDRRWFVDGKRVDPDKPPDPNAPPFTTNDPRRPEKPANCALE